MAERIDIRREAMARQGSVVKHGLRRYLIEGDSRSARFQMGEEGLVHYAIEPRTGIRIRIKCFWEPDDDRMERSRYLVQQRLARRAPDGCDVLGGAPFAFIDSLGQLSRFALVMRNVPGESWKDLRQTAEQEPAYPPPGWPSLKTRILWAYALVCAVERMEARDFVHADLSDGNVLVVPGGDRAGEAALVDFDAYYNPRHPSKYRGTNGFVAPEIWDRGPVGIGSDRIAMAVLIQDMLVVGDPDIGRQDAFSAKYTQDELCAYSGRAHFLLWQRERALAQLFEATLKAAAPADRPSPAQWKQELLRLCRQAPWRRHTLQAEDNPAIRISLNAPGRQDLTLTPFAIRGDLTRSDEGEASLFVHPSARIRLRTPEQPWRWLEAATEAGLVSDSVIFDPSGQFPGRFVIDEAASGTWATPESFEAPAEPEHSRWRELYQEGAAYLQRPEILWFMVSLLAGILLIVLLSKLL
jgi:serine/threonine protein kinase